MRMFPTTKWTSKRDGARSGVAAMLTPPEGKPATWSHPSGEPREIGPGITWRAALRSGGNWPHKRKHYDSETGRVLEFVPPM